MKKLLLGVLSVGLFLQETDASIFGKNKINESEVDERQQRLMGHNYTGMVNFVEVLLTGWSKALSEAAKKSEFKKDKKTIQTVSEQFKTIAEYMTSILNRKEDAEKKSKAYDAVLGELQKDGTRKGGLTESLILLSDTGYWKDHHGNHLRLSILTIYNAFNALVRRYEEYKIAGVVCLPRSINKSGIERLATSEDSRLPELADPTYDKRVKPYIEYSGDTEPMMIPMYRAFSNLYRALWKKLEKDVRENQYL